MTIFASVIACLAGSSVQASNCTAAIESDDALRFKPSHIDVPSTCTDFTITLTHTGRLPKAAMGHNWVLVKSGDLEGVARTGMLAGADHQYIDSTDSRVIAYTGLIGSGGSTSVKFSVDKLQLGQKYAFLCTFAGHSPVMQGTVSLKP